MTNPFVEEISRQIAEATGLSRDKLADLIQTPPNPDMGDYALPCFVLAKTLRRPPNQIAQDLAQAVETGDRISEVRPSGPYLNFFVRPGALVSGILSQILSRGPAYGRAETDSGKTVLIDFSSPNIAKPFTIAHLRSTAIGNSLCKLYDALGWHVVGINHLGDWGATHAMNIAAYKRWGDEEVLRRNPPYELFNLYVKFNAELEGNPSLREEVQSWNQKLHAGDPEALHLWELFRGETLKDFKRMYSLMGVEFTEYIGESFFRDQVEPIIESLKAKGLAVESEGALVVMLDEYDMPPAIILTGAGTSVYLTRDLAAAIHRKTTYDFDRMVYTTDSGQSLHFRQVFKVLELMGYEWAADCVHVPFGLISFQEGKMSSRRGNVIFLEDVIDRANELTRDIVRKKNPDLPNGDEIARQVGIGAIIYADLNSRRNRDIVFAWGEILNFNGETGPYIQYTHARYCSVLRKYGGVVPPPAVDFSLLTEPETIAVVKCLESFPARIGSAAEAYEPSLIATYLIELCTAANRFYNAHRVISDDDSLTKARIALVHAITVVLASGIGLLGMAAPEQM